MNFGGAELQKTGKKFTKIRANGSCARTNFRKIRGHRKREDREEEEGEGGLRYTIVGS